MAGTLVSGCGGGGGGSSSSDGEPMPDLSGVISMESRTRVDVDTADDIRLGVNGTNDSASTAQVLPNTAVVGGYLSFSSGRYQTGTSDVFEYPADRVDTYAASLSEGDRISLQIFGAPEGFLLSAVAPQRQITVRDADTNDEVLTFTQSTGSLPISEVLPGTFEEGNYLIEVSTSGGSPFRYVLTLAGEGAQSMMSTRYAEPDFLLDEAVVTLRPALMSAKDAGAVAQAMSANNARPLGGNSWHLRRSTAQPLSALSAQASKQARDDTVAWIRELQQRPDIAYAEPNYLYNAQVVQPDNDPLYSRQWNYPLINLPLAWQVAPEAGVGVGIAILDTGLFRNTPAAGGAWHPDLAANVVTLPGQIMDYVSAELDIDNRFGDPLGRDTNPADPGDGKAQSSNFHGTHVAGIAGAVDNTRGVIGVAPEANILPVRVLGEDGVGNSADLVAAINWAAMRSEIDVINLSLGGLGPSQSLQDAIDRAVAGGKLVVAAAGNQATDEPTFPAAFANVVGVGAVDGAGVRSSYSNVGESVNLVAPGGDASRDANQDNVADLIGSTWGSDDGGEFVASYAGLQGTSMAAPHVSGVYALMKSVQPAMTPDMFFTLMVGGQLTSSPPNRTEYGVGMIDALKAVDAAQDGQTSTILAATPSGLQFNGVVNRQDFSLVTYPSDAEITVTDVRVNDAPWIASVNLANDLVDSDEPVTVSVDTTGLDPTESYRGDIVIEYSSSGTDPTLSPLTIPVTLQFGGSSEDLNAGRHYVLLVSTDDDRDTMAQSVVEASDGQYRYAFDDVPPGEYFLVAGTDMDNNGLICENGEACAEYPVNGLPEKIVIGESPLADVTLSTSFRRPTITSMGMPRYGFEGYRLKSEETAPDEPVRAVETNR
ncbi:MAG: S8 family serine peptidase [Marinobacter sp.]|uniref:S8 family serine peptidase n=1 Tax=Marinobacter sp. TaxID=50741 RepID=UPI003C457CE1